MHFSISSFLNHLAVVNNIIFTRCSLLHRRAKKIENKFLNASAVIRKQAFPNIFGHFFFLRAGRRSFLISLRMCSNNFLSRRYAIVVCHSVAWAQAICCSVCVCVLTWTERIRFSFHQKKRRFAAVSWRSEFDTIHPKNQFGCAQELMYLMKLLVAKFTSHPQFKFREIPLILQFVSYGGKHSIVERRLSGALRFYI